MRNEINVVGIYNGQDDQIMIAGKVFRRGHVSETLVSENLYAMLREESDKDGWFKIKEDSYEEFLNKKKRTHFRDVEIQVGKKEESLTDEIADEKPIESVEQEDTKEEPIEEKPKKKTKKVVKEDESEVTEG